MSVYDTMTSVTNGCLIAFVVLAVLLIITVVISAIGSVYWWKSSIPIVIFAIVGFLFICSAFATIISVCVVKEKKYTNATHHIEQMAEEHEARVIEKENLKEEYISYFEGYGGAEWVYFKRAPDSEDKYRN